ncbi:MAG: hypothetical protein ACKER6_00845 [Candidatus Hodgkinia cicadicola]
METISIYESTLWAGDADLALTLGFKRPNTSNSIPLTRRPLPSLSVIEAQSAALMLGRTNTTVLHGVANLVALRAAECFGCDYVNVWLTDAGQAACASIIALLRSGDTVMDVGPRWATSAPEELFGMNVQIVPAGWDIDKAIVNMAEVSAMALQHKPKMIIAGADGGLRPLDWKALRAIADSVNAYLVADVSACAALICGRAWPSPFPHCHVAVLNASSALMGASGSLLMTSNAELVALLREGVFICSSSAPSIHALAGLAAALREASQASAWAASGVFNASVLCHRLSCFGVELIACGTSSHTLAISTRNIKTEPELIARTLSQLGFAVTPSRLHGPSLWLNVGRVTAFGFTLKHIFMIAEVLSDVLESIRTLGNLTFELHERALRRHTALLRQTTTLI